jgi:hypothetical protein
MHARDPIVRFEYFGHPIAFLGDKAQVIVMSADYVMDVGGAREASAAHREDYPTPSAG